MKKISKAEAERRYRNRDSSFTGTDMVAWLLMMNLTMDDGYSESYSSSSCSSYDSYSSDSSSSSSCD